MRMAEMDQFEGKIINMIIRRDWFITVGYLYILLTKKERQRLICFRRWGNGSWWTGRI